MPKSKPSSATLIDLEWARVYAGMIQEELKFIAETLEYLNGHVMNAGLVKGAVTLRRQLKRASKLVGEMREGATQSEVQWKAAIKTALATKSHNGIDRSH